VIFDTKTKILVDQTSIFVFPLARQKIEWNLFKRISFGFTT